MSIVNSFWSQTLAEYFAISSKSGDFGVEIEYEGSRLPMEVVGWRTTRDGSLRGEENIEYVLSRPMSLKGVNESLFRLGTSFKENKTKINETIRAGTHIHINMLGRRLIELVNIVVGYYILEELLTRFCGPDRVGNQFCLRVCDAEFSLDRFISFVVKRDFRELSGDNIRYSALNFNSLSRHGSIEFRAGKSTRDLEHIYEWICILNELKENCIKFNDPREIVELYSGNGAEVIANELLPKFAKKVILIHPDFEECIRKGVRYGQQIAYSGKFY